MWGLRGTSWTIKDIKDLKEKKKARSTDTTTDTPPRKIKEEVEGLRVDLPQPDHS